AAEDRHARLRQPHLGRDDVYDALARVPHGLADVAELRRVALHLRDLSRGDRLGRLLVRRDVVLHRRGHELGTPHAALREPTAFASMEGDREYVDRLHGGRDDRDKDRRAQRSAWGRLRAPRIHESGDAQQGAYRISKRVPRTPLDPPYESALPNALPAVSAS